MALSSIPPVLSTRHARAYADHLRRCYPQTGGTTLAHVVIAARITLPALREAMQCRLDVASALEAEWAIERRNPPVIVTRLYGRDER